MLESAGGAPVDGVYVTGWIKRGPSGVIGTNKACAKETVRGLLEDFQSGSLSRPVGSRKDLTKLVAQRQPARIDYRGWQAIDAAERAGAPHPVARASRSPMSTRCSVRPGSAAASR